MSAPCNPADQGPVCSICKIVARTGEKTYCDKCSLWYDRGRKLLTKIKQTPSARIDAEIVAPTGLRNTFRQAREGIDGWRQIELSFHEVVAVLAAHGTSVQCKQWDTDDASARAKAQAQARKRPKAQPEQPQPEPEQRARPHRRIKGISKTKAKCETNVARLTSAYRVLAKAYDDFEDLPEGDPKVELRRGGALAQLKRTERALEDAVNIIVVHAKTARTIVESL